MSSEQRDDLSLNLPYEVTYSLQDIALALCEMHESLTYDALIKEYRRRPIGSLKDLVASAYHVAEVDRLRDEEGNEYVNSISRRFPDGLDNDL